MVACISQDSKCIVIQVILYFVNETAKFIWPDVCERHKYLPGPGFVSALYFISNKNVLYFFPCLEGKLILLYAVIAYGRLLLAWK